MKSKPSKLDAHAEQLAAWFGGPEKLSLAQAQARLAGLRCKVSTGRLSGWWSARQTRSAIDQALVSVATGSRMGRELEAAFAKDPAPELKLLIALLKNLVLNLTLKGATDPAAMEMAGALLKSVLDFAKLEAKEREQALDLKRFQRETCELFLRWAAEQRAKAIADSPATNSEKIAQLGELMFGADWKA